MKTSFSRVKARLILLKRDVALSSVCVLAFIIIPLQAQFDIWKDHSEAARKAYLGKNYPESERLYLLALRELEKTGSDNPAIAEVLDALAIVYNAQSQYAESEILYLRSLEIREKSVGPDDLAVAGSAERIGALYGSQGRWAEAEPRLRRGLALREKALGAEDPRIVPSLNELARCLGLQKNYAEGESILKRALALEEKQQPGPSATRAVTLTYLAGNYLSQQRYTEAEPLYIRCIEIQFDRQDTKMVVFAMNNLALLYRKQGRYREAELLYKKSLDGLEKEFGKDHPSMLATLQYYVILLRSAQRHREAEQLLARMQKIQKIEDRSPR